MCVSWPLGTGNLQGIALSKESTHMEIWNREELYSAVWEQPLIKLTEKYAVSAVMLGKVYRKLKIPLPGRGYWARKQAGQTVSRKPLPEAKNLPALQRFKTVPKEPAPPQPEPIDPEYLQIKEVEN